MNQVKSNKIDAANAVQLEVYRNIYEVCKEHFKKIAETNSKSVRKVEQRLSWAYVLLAVSLLLFAVSAGTTMIYKFCQISFIQEDDMMGDESTKQISNTTGNSNSGNNSQTPPPALEKPVLVPLNAEPLKRCLGPTDIPKLVQMIPESLKYSETEPRPNTGEKKQS
jgi:hypothetical protein